ncbi:uncharacterized protein LOC144120583 isoform X2 [Amblyomma americanum]
MKPDGPWSWVVAVACSCMNFFSVVMIRSAGVVYVNVVEYFNVSRQEAAWPISVVPASANLIGPIVALAVRRFGVRPVAIFGTVMSSVAVMLCFFAPNVLVLTLLLGVFHGMGTGMTITPNAVCLNEWFEEKKVRASGIIYAGATLGSFVFPVLFKYCNDIYGIRGCFLIFGAVMMHSTVCSLFVRSPPWVWREKRLKARRKQAEKNTSLNKRNEHTALPEATTGSDSGRENRAFDWSVDDKKSEHINMQQLEVSGTQHSRKTRVNIQPCKENAQFTGLSDRSAENCGWSDFVNDYPRGKSPAPALQRSVSQDYSDCRGDVCRQSKNDPAVISPDVDQLHHPASPDISQLSGPRHRVRRSSSSASSLSNFYCIYEPAAHSNAITSIPESESNDETESGADESPTPTGRQEEKKRLFGVILVMVTITYVFVTNANMLFMTVVMDFARDRGIVLDEAVYLLSAFAAADIAGRLSCGWVADTGLVEKKTILGLSCAMFGLVMQVIPFCTEYIGLMCACISTGYGVGNSVVLFSVILGEGVGVKRIPAAMGVITFFSGLTAFGRPALIGFFRDNIGSYDNMLRATGVVLIVVGLAWLFLRLLERSRSRSFKLNTSTQETSFP